MPDSEPQSVPVAIVGGGPVGLLLALLGRVIGGAPYIE